MLISAIFISQGQGECKNMGVIENKHSPVFPEQEYIWYGKRKDGSFIYEYDNDKNETMFDYIDAASITEFGMLGNGITFSFNIQSGNFYINDKLLEIDVNIGDEKVNTSGPKDLIEYKLAHTDGVVQGRTIKKYTRTIDGYFVGYKMLIKNNTYYQVNIGIPVSGADRRPFIGFKVCAPKNTELGVSLNNSKKESVKLQKNKTGYLNVYF